MQDSYCCNLALSVMEAMSIPVPVIPFFVSRPSPPLPSAQHGMPALLRCLISLAQAKNLVMSVSSRVILNQ